MAKKKKDRYGLGGEVHFQMAPLIDVVFLLLIFFITVTTFHQTEKVDMVLAWADMAEELKETQEPLVVNVTKYGEIIVAVGGVGRRRFVDKGPLQEFMQGLVSEAGGPDFRVAIRADRYAKMKEIKDIYRAAARAGLTRISLVTQTRTEQLRRAPGSPPPGKAGPEDDDLIY